MATLFMDPLDKHKDSWVKRLTDNHKACHIVHLIIESLHCKWFPLVSIHMEHKSSQSMIILKSPSTYLYPDVLVTNLLIMFPSIP